MKPLEQMDKEFEAESSKQCFAIAAPMLRSMVSRTEAERMCQKASEWARQWTLKEVSDSDAVQYVKFRETLWNANRENDKLKEELTAQKTLIEEMAKAVEHVRMFCLCSRRVNGFDYGDDHENMGKAGPDERWATPPEIDAVEAIEMKAYEDLEIMQAKCVNVIVERDAALKELAELKLAHDENISLLKDFQDLFRDAEKEIERLRTLLRDIAPSWLPEGIRARRREALREIDAKEEKNNGIL